MPTLSYDKKDLLSLIGKKLSDKELEEIINLIKPNVEEMGKDEIRVEHCADRPDLFGIEGLARAVRSYLGIEKGLKKFLVEDARMSVKVEPVKIRPYIACAIIKNFKPTSEAIKSLMNIQEVLHETLGRKREKVAIGIHDLDKIEPPIKYTAVSRAEKFIPLECEAEMSLEEVLEKTEKGRKYGHIIRESKFWPVYVDSRGIFSFPPIINSDRTKVTEKTRNLFVEVTGIEKKALLQTLNILVTNFAERKCKIEAVRVKYPGKTEVTPELKEEVIQVDPKKVNELIGLNLSASEMIELLERMGYEASLIRGKLQVIIPCYRVDILHAVDIIEDVAIAYGYNNLVPEFANVATIGKPLALEKLCAKARQLMIGFGFQEILRPVLTNPRDQFERMNLEASEVIEIENFVSEEYTCLRKWLIPGLLKVLAVNKHVEYPQKLFEIGDVVIPDKREETMSKNLRKLACVISHSKASFSEIKSVVESFLRNLGVDYRIEEFKHPSFIEGRVAKVVGNRKELGFFGEISPLVLEKWELEMPVSAFEINLEEMKV